jgi:hypothetical protein
MTDDHRRVRRSRLCVLLIAAACSCSSKEDDGLDPELSFRLMCTSDLVLDIKNALDKCEKLCLIEPALDPPQRKRVDEDLNLYGVGPDRYARGVLSTQWHQIFRRCVLAFTKDRSTWGGPLRVKFQVAAEKFWLSDDPAERLQQLRTMYEAATLPP